MQRVAIKIDTDEEREARRERLLERQGMMQGLEDVLKRLRLIQTDLRTIRADQRKALPGSAAWLALDETAEAKRAEMDALHREAELFTEGMKRIQSEMGK